jgi:hypothetical protein
MEEYVTNYVPLALYTYGLCYYGHHGDPHKTIKVEADNRNSAYEQAQTLLQPSTTESVCFIAVEPNLRYHYEVRIPFEQEMLRRKSCIGLL